MVKGKSMASVDDSPSSLRLKLKQSLCFSCFFGRRHGNHLPLRSPPLLPSDGNPTLIWVPPHDQSLSEIKDKCCSILGITGAKDRRHTSSEFSYDPSSYARNFEDGFEFDDEAPLKSFSARLPPSSSLRAAVS